MTFACNIYPPRMAIADWRGWESMQTKSESKVAGSGKLWITLYIIAGSIYLLDFSFYGRHLYDLAAASGFALLAFGAYKNDNVAGTAGAVLALGGIAAKLLN